MSSDRSETTDLTGKRKARERGNRTFREEFYSRPNLLADSIGAMGFELKKATEKHNTYRPHCVLKGLTPMEYINNTILQAA